MKSGTTVRCPRILSTVKRQIVKGGFVKFKFNRFGHGHPQILLERLMNGFLK